MVKNNVQQMRWNKGYSLRQLAIKSGVPKSTIESLENRQVLNPTIETAYRLAKALEVRIDELFEYGKCFI